MPVPHLMEGFMRARFFSSIVLFLALLTPVFGQRVITTIAGKGNGGFGRDNGPAIKASLFGPLGIAVDSGGNIFIADTNNNRVRKITPDGIITTVAGNGQNGSAGDGGPATAAQLNGP